MSSPSQRKPQPRSTPQETPKGGGQQGGTPPRDERSRQQQQESPRDRSPHDPREHDPDVQERAPEGDVETERGGGRNPQVDVERE